MKYISFAIPCYNSEAYMTHAIESILPGGEDVEIIIVNDGSKDNTSRIGHEYAEKYPDIIKVIDKENGGHGDAVNSGLAAASGKYFKVVDSDDWVKEESLHRILQVLRGFEEEEISRHRPGQRLWRQHPARSSYRPTAILREITS